MLASVREAGTAATHQGVVGPRRPDLLAVIPAHDEQDAIGDTLLALDRQMLRPGHVLVVADNCTDETGTVALRHGATVLQTVDNTDRKAGALNQALSRLAGEGLEYVLVLDADTRITPDFLEVAVAALDSDPTLGAVSGLFAGNPPDGVLQQLQANEYARYTEQILATGRVAVVTGTASVFRTEALRDVAAQRGTTLPGQPGDVYDRSAITEDSELTLALKSRGWRLTAPERCVCYTELMPTWGDLHRQRVRWYKGMLDNLRSYGLSRLTARYFGQQLMIAVGTVTLALLLVITVASVVSGTFSIRPLWLAVGGIFVVERLVSVWAVGRDGRILAAAVLPEIGYDLALQSAFVHALALAATQRDTGWNHVTHASSGGADAGAHDPHPSPMTEKESTMYELNTTTAGTTLALTGAGIAQGWIAAWTLFVAGLALLTIGRITKRRHHGATAGE